MEGRDVISNAWDAVEKAWKTERSMLVGIMLLVLAFLSFIMRLSTSSQKEARDAYLASIERQWDKMTQSLDRNTDALKDNTTIMIELETKFYK